jgi:hypothetical protein
MRLGRLLDYTLYIQLESHSGDGTPMIKRPILTILTRSHFVPRPPHRKFSCPDGISSTFVLLQTNINSSLQHSLKLSLQSLPKECYCYRFCAGSVYVICSRLRVSMLSRCSHVVGPSLATLFHHFQEYGVKRLQNWHGFHQLQNRGSFCLPLASIFDAAQLSNSGPRVFLRSYDYLSGDGQPQTFQPSRKVYNWKCLILHLIRRPNNNCAVSPPAISFAPRCVNPPLPSPLSYRQSPEYSCALFLQTLCTYYE